MKSHKNDDRDAEAIAEAATRPTMRFVPIKSEEQLDVQSLHRARERLVGTRTALINQLRGVLFDRGIVIAKGRPKLNLWLLENPPNNTTLTARIQRLVHDMVDELHALDHRIKQLDQEFEALAKPMNEPVSCAVCQALARSTQQRWQQRSATCRRLPRGVTSLPGWACSTADHDRRQAAADGISKRGSTNMRVMLIHGARAALPYLARMNTQLGAWLRALLQRAKRNVVVVALANKLARIAWAVMSNQRPYEALMASKG